MIILSIIDSIIITFVIKKVVSLTETSSEWKQQCYFLTTLPEMVPPETNCNVSIYKFVFTKINLIFKLHF